MEDTERINKLLNGIKLDLGLNDSDISHDNYLITKIDDALYDIKRYVDPSHLDISHIPITLIDKIIKKIVILYYNRRGLEGTGYFSEGGLTFSYKEKNEALNDLSRFQKPTLTNIRESGNRHEI